MTYRVIATPAKEAAKFDYHVEGEAVQGRSTSPLLDACRQLKRMGADPGARAALFHRGSSDWALRCRVGRGAELMVADLRFIKYHA